jgi:LemA protein
VSPEISERSFEEAIACALLQYGPDACGGDATAVRETPPPYGDAPPGGYRKRKPEDYDRSLCLLPRDVLDFVLATQPKEWKKLEQHHGAGVREQFLKRLAAEIERRGALDVLRNGLKDSGCKFRLAYFRPASGLNEETRRLHAANLFAVVRQVYYSAKNEKSLDLVLFLNGIPIFEPPSHLTRRNRMGTTFVVMMVIIAIAVFYIVSIYNRLVELKNRFKNAFSQIEVQLKRRYDLIPNLVETAKGYIKHERETLEAVIQARNAAISGLGRAHGDPGNADAIHALSQAEGNLAGALGRLNVVMEAYPDLKANQNMMQVSEELTSTENRVAFARQAFNDAVTEYNIYKQTFPPVFFAAMFGHAQDAALLEFEDSAAIQEAPKVTF